MDLCKAIYFNETTSFCKFMNWLTYSPCLQGFHHYRDAEKNNPWNTNTELIKIPH